MEKAYQDTDSDFQKRQMILEHIREVTAIKSRANNLVSECQETIERLYNEYYS